MKISVIAASQVPYYTSSSNGTTGIHAIENGQSTMEKDVFYNLQGQRVNNPGKGLYIKNGKKVVIR